MKITNYSQNQNNKKTPTFKGPFDSAITQTLAIIDTNPMVNAAAIDIGAMVLPRTYIDTKKRNEYAGAETFFREIASTIISCFSAGFVAASIAGLYNKTFDKNTNISKNLWITNDAFETLNKAWENAQGSTNTYVKNVLNNTSALDGRKVNKWENIDWNKIQWYEKQNWDKIQWKDNKWNKIHERTKSEQGIINTLSEAIVDKTIQQQDKKHLFEILEHRITNAIKANASIDVQIEDKKLNTTLKNLIRDIYDAGSEIFTKKNINIERAGIKLQSMNKVKTLGTITIVSTIGLVTQHLNRQLTKKRTGSDAFVGSSNFGTAEIKPLDKKEKRNLVLGKVAASTGLLALATGVMNVRKPADFVKRLEFAAPITSGNVIKTIYTATLIGRFIAAKDKNELRESVTRDYLGFLNWLVFGGFVAKGVAQLAFDKKQNTLFNIKKEGKGVGHWLKDVSLKTHAEIAAQGKDFAKKNIWKLNVAHAAGLLYSGLALGFAVPLLNIFMTRQQELKEKLKLKQTQKNKTIG